MRQQVKSEIIRRYEELEAYCQELRKSVLRYVPCLIRVNLRPSLLEGALNRVACQPTTSYHALCYLRICDLDKDAFPDDWCT